MKIPTKTRCIAAVAGLVNAIAGLFLSPLAPLTVAASALLIAGAAGAGRFPRHGRNLMWFGAFFTSLFAIPINLYLLRSWMGRDIQSDVIIGAWLSLLLVLLCDVVVVMDERRASHTLSTAQLRNK